MDRQIYKNFETFFKKATGNKPYPYQKNLAEVSPPSVISIPTGAGKTEAAILGIWLWNRLKDNHHTPRRLIYCLPRRVLVEQTKTRVETWLENLGLKERIGVALLMGGNTDEDLEKHPDQEYVIIGTQDMLVSGALNRAYGTNPYKWPIIFGLLNNDSMWIMDEIQIMENALPTSIQLDAFRKFFGTFGPHHTVWMSATINPKWLKTVDASLSDEAVYSLSQHDTKNEILSKRNSAVKNLHKANIEMNKKYDRNDVKAMHGLHQKGTVTAIMVNTVKRAQELYDLFTKEKFDCKLIHSRFRTKDREELNSWVQNIKEDDDKIIISTQVLEAGVDISVRTLITEIAPWSNMVQRFGRCNRTGKHDGDVYWIDIPNDNHYAPYESDDMVYSRIKLEEMSGQSVAPNNLPQYEEPRIFDAVLRRKDIVDLFDTTQDLSGNYVDASRFVRTIKKQLDVEVFWRDDDEESAPEREETCSVPIYDLREFLKKHETYGRVWNYKDRKWEKVWHTNLIPGQKIMIDSKKGGYSKTHGWNKECKDRVDIIENHKTVNDSNDSDPQSHSGIALTLEDHTKHVVHEAQEILKNLEFLDEDMKHAIVTAAKYHDIGKTHQVFQDTMRRAMSNNTGNEKIWAKSDGKARHKIPGFRHEVASALAYLANTEQSNTKNLVTYLIASHHGKVRLALRNPSRKRGDEKYLLGMKVSGDELPKFSSKTVSIDKTIIDMSIAQIGNRVGGSSWTERMLKLRDKYGPFCLGYLELIIRAADTFASKKEKEPVSTGGKYSS